MLFHYSEEADKIFSRDYPTPPDNDHKPGGLWLTDDSDYGWCDFVLARLSDGSPCWADAGKELRYKYGFTIDPCLSDKVLKLKTPDDLRWFTSHYREAACRECVVDGEPGYGVHIDWERVKAHYKGILITPFHPNLALAGKTGKDPFYHWYRFDCASGCFWDITCLTQVTGGIKTNLPKL